MSHVSVPLTALGIMERNFLVGGGLGFPIEKKSGVSQINANNNIYIN